MVSFILLAVAAALTTTYGQNLNVTNSTQDFFFLSQSELLHEIEIAELKNDAFDVRFGDRLRVIHFQQDQLLAEVNRIRLTLMPLQALSLVRKHCIQKYNKQLISYDIAKYRLDNCYNTAAQGAPNLTSGPKSSVSSAKRYIINNMPYNVAACDSYYANNQTALDECYIEYVNTGKNTTKTYLNSARQQLKRSEYEADFLSDAAIECTFEVEKDVLENITLAIHNINTCEVELNKQSSVANLKSLLTRN